MNIKLKDTSVTKGLEITRSVDIGEITTIKDKSKIFQQLNVKCL